MQLRHVLILAAVDDEAVARWLQVEFGHQALGRLEEIGQESSVGFPQVGQTAKGFLGHDQDVDRITRLGMTIVPASAGSK